MPLTGHFGFFNSFWPCANGIPLFLRTKSAIRRKKQQNELAISTHECRCSTCSVDWCVSFIRHISIEFHIFDSGEFSSLFCGCRMVCFLKMIKISPKRQTDRPTDQTHMQTRRPAWLVLNQNVEREILAPKSSSLRHVYTYVDGLTTAFTIFVTK